MTKSKEILAQQERALGGDLLELRVVEPAARRTDPAIDLPRVGTIGHAEGVALAVEDRLQFVLERALAHAGGADLHIRLPAEQQAELREPRHHLLGEHRLQLVGRPGQHAKHLAVLFHPEAGRRAVGVEQEVAALELVGLLEIVGRHLAPEAREPLGDGLLEGGVEHQFLPEHRRQGLARAVVARRAEAAGRDDHVGARPAFAKLRGDGVGLVREGDIALQHDTPPAKLLADEGQVAVGGESQQQFVAQRQQLIVELGNGLAPGRAGRRVG